MIAKTERVILKKCRTSEEAQQRADKVKLKEGDPRVIEITFYPKRYYSSHLGEKPENPNRNSRGTYEVALVRGFGEGWG